MRIALVVAMARNRVIGRDNRLPWRLPGDMRHFRELTLGKPVIMGRLTFESIGRPLPGRTNIVVSAAPGVALPDAVLRASDIAHALALAGAVAERDGVEECMVIGGGQVYRACLPLADRIYLTVVDADIPGDTLFPALTPDDWRETSRIRGPRDAGDAAAYTFLVLERNRTAASASSG